MCRTQQPKAVKKYKWIKDSKPAKFTVVVDWWNILAKTYTNHIWSLDVDRTADRDRVPGPSQAQAL
jgi:hypothetical protein